MAQSIFEYNETFKAALRRTKFRIDAASKEKIEIFGKPWYDKHFTVGRVPHMLSDFNTILGKMHLNIAASTINGKSAEPLRMNEGFNQLAQKMFTHAHAYKMDADTIRELLLMAKAAQENADVQAVDYIADELFDYNRKAVQGVRERIDYIILYTLAHGKYQVTAANDPNSPFVGQEWDFGISSSNIDTVGAGQYWVDGASVDPIAQIGSVLNNVRHRYKKILLSRSSMMYLLSNSALKGYINSQLYPNLPLSEAIINRWMQENGFPTFEVVEKSTLIQKGASLSEINPWDEQYQPLVFLPDDQIGTIETRLSDAELGMKSEGVKYANYGRIELRTFTQGERENADYAEIIKASVTAAPSMDTADQILILKTKEGN